MNGSRGVSALSRPQVEKTPRAQANPALALRKVEAADVLAMSVDSFERYVLPEIRVVRRGALVLVPVTELERWIEENAAMTIEAAR